MLFLPADGEDDSVMPEMWEVSEIAGALRVGLPAPWRNHAIRPKFCEPPMRSVAFIACLAACLAVAGAQHGFPRRFGAGVIITSGALGILTPPSIIPVLYGVLTNISIGALFAAGVVPGITLAALLATDVVLCLAQRLSRMKRASWSQRLRAFRDSVWDLLLIVIVLAGIASGIARMGITELTVAVLPWLITMLCFLALVTYWPALSLWLPQLLGIKY